MLKVFFLFLFIQFACSKLVAYESQSKTCDLKSSPRLKEIDLGACYHTVGESCYIDYFDDAASYVMGFNCSYDCGSFSYYEFELNTCYNVGNEYSFLDDKYAIFFDDVWSCCNYFGDEYLSCEDSFGETCCSIPESNGDSMRILYYESGNPDCSTGSSLKSVSPNVCKSGFDHHFGSACMISRSGSSYKIYDKCDSDCCHGNLIESSAGKCIPVGNAVLLGPRYIYIIEDMDECCDIFGSECNYYFESNCPEETRSDFMSGYVAFLGGSVFLAVIVCILIPSVPCILIIICCIFCCRQPEHHTVVFVK
eukprot:TRINITY_DN4872_c0_g1_i1.p1 TRINITY_DN4872_c0_g1~~TRINITY_DN4872_c0_g1_i1.p1  ORF type:complete len:308 (+),score=31.35 TRINITY_DN4872_c0_g1_i1:367-1290(+)